MPAEQSSRIALLAEDELILQPLKLGKHSFPGIWRYMLPEAIQGFTWPEEKRASCSQCPKACYDSYRPDYRCCTYHPRVANFLLGFASLSPAGERAFDQALGQGMLLPEGMHASPQQWLDFMDDQEHDRYGRSQTVLCPLLDASSGLCQIHPFRNAVCSSFFCYHDQGEAGQVFWAQLQTLGSQLELSLSQWALRQVGFDLDRYFKALDSLSKQVQELSAAQGWRAEVLQGLWGDWFGREKQLFRECAVLIAEQRDQLWTIASQEPIREAAEFERALDTLLPPEESAEEDSDESPQFDPRLTWQACLEAYSILRQVSPDLD